MEMVTDAKTREQLRILQFDMGLSANAYQIHEEREAVYGLQKKMSLKPDVITGQLRTKVESALELYTQS